MRQRVLLAVVGLLALLALHVQAGDNMRRVGALTLNQSLSDNHGFYAATVDETNGFAYFASRFIYKVDIRGALPVQVGTGTNLSGQSVDGVMDPAAGCAYFASGNNIFQVLANGTNALTLGPTILAPFGTDFPWGVVIDASDPANHYLYVMCESSSGVARLYKIALNLYPSANAVLGFAAVNANEPPLYHGVIDVTNHCAYFGSLFATNVPYVVKFALGAGTNLPSRVAGLALDSTLRSIGPLALDIGGGYGYCCTIGNDTNFGSARVYMFALNGGGAPTLVTHTDMRAAEGYNQVAFIKPDRRLLYFACDLTYPGKVYRFRLGSGTNAPVETGALSCLSITNPTPAWGNNPPYASNNWGEIFLHSVAYDSVRDFVYFGRDYADQQTQPYFDQIIKVAADRDEMLMMLTDDGANANNTIPYGESFESYPNGFSLVGTNGWSGEDSAMGVVTANNYTNSYAGTFPLPGPHQLSLLVDGGVTNRFSMSGYSNVWVDMILQAVNWTDPLLPDTNVLGGAPFAVIVTTNGHLAVWNRTNAPAAGNGWTELLDTHVNSNQFARVTIKANYATNASGIFYYSVWLTGVLSTNPSVTYATANTAQNSFGDVVAKGHFYLDDLVVRNTDPFAMPLIRIGKVARNASGSVTLNCTGVPQMNHRIWATTSVMPPASWQPVSTNLAAVDGSFTFTDANATNYATRFYRASFP